MIALFAAQAAADSYLDFPVTLKDYEGDKESSVSYTGQSARHVLHDSLKAAVGQVSFGDEAANLELMNRYFSETGTDRAVLSPVSSAGFEVTPDVVSAISGGKNLADKAYKGAVPAWPGYLNGEQVLADMIARAARTEGGFDPVTGHDYQQLISKFAMGAVFYNQAVDNYLDELLAEDVKPNDQAYSDGAAYTGKEHVWDEAFGYFGAPADVLNMSAQDVYDIAKKNADIAERADVNGNGSVDLHGEMAYAHAYYAAGFDKGGKTNYLHTIAQAFYDGRDVIRKAKGDTLSKRERNKLYDYADVIAANWELVLAEAAFKYAGSTYSDIEKLNIILEADGNAAEAYRTYAKHWGELKGFAMALQVGGRDLGETAFELNSLIGFSPVLPGDSQVVGIDADGEMVQRKTKTLAEYQADMVRVQALLAANFDLQAKSNDVTASMTELLEQLNSGGSVEND
ncbi:hypothetical protein MED297_17103 [Reinekea sp. MED297]|uniref:DUF4856 domain-containing protein n=2 Tax=Reinekea TaxID=230494 RepID=A4BFI6_9GAMM|nr:hypothetical protein MED297_17103 [Reinekea sp. MED297] [Reinekea blandensis MED297]